MMIRYLLIILFLAVSLTSFGETITIDNPDARVTFVGSWATSSNTSGGGPYGPNYRHDNASGKGTKQAICRPNLPQTGPWLVYEYHSNGTNRAKNVPIQIVDAEGTHSVTLNQQVNGGTFRLLGRYNFAAGQGAVIYSTEGTTNYVLFDALRFVNDSTPTLACAPLQLAPVAEVGTDATSQTLTVGNSGGQTLNFALSADVPWISLAQTTGTVSDAAQGVGVRYQTAGLAQGTYDGAITVTAVGALNAPQVIPVQLRVTTGPVLDVTPNPGVAVSGLEGGPFVPATVQFGVENLGGGNLNWTATADPDWLTLAPTSGVGATTVTATVNAHANTLAGSQNGVAYAGLIHFRSNGGETTRSVMLNVLQGAQTITIDNTDARASYVGSWAVSSNTSGGGPYGANYRHDNGTGKGTKQAICAPNLPEAGYWWVYEYHSASTNRAKNVPVTVRAADGEHQLSVNQQVSGGTFNVLGRYYFAAGAGTVEYATTGTTGIVVYDALRFVLEPSTRLVCDASQLVAQAVPGYNAASQTLHVRNGGSGVLNYQVTADVPWIVIAGGEGSSTGEEDAVEVNFATAGLAAGDYTATLTVAAPGAAGAPLQIPVALSLAPPPALTLTPTGVLRSSGLEGGPFVFNGTSGLQIENSGGGLLQWSVTSDQPWLSMTPASGSTAAHASSMVTLAINSAANGLAGSAAGETYTAELRVNTNAPAGMQTRVVRLRVLHGAQTITIDNRDARVSYTGSWAASSNTGGGGPYLSDYRHDNNSGKGTKKVVCAPNLPVAGNWWVYEYHSAGTNRASNVPVEIDAADGTHSLTLNQKATGGAFGLLGRFTFVAGAGKITYLNAGTNGYVFFDALRFVQEPAAPPEPSLELASDNPAANSGNVGRPAPKQVFKLSNGGTGTLHYSVESDAAWLTVEPSSGVVDSGQTAELVLHYDTAGLAPGVYSARLTIAAPDADNAPQVHDITLAQYESDNAIIIDNEDAGFVTTEGAWVFSRETSGGQPYNGSMMTNTVETTEARRAEFHATLDATALYDLYEWHTAAPDHDPWVLYQISTTTGTQGVRVDQQVHGGQFNYLGRFMLPAGEATRVELLARSNATVVADAIMLRPVPEPTLHVAPRVIERTYYTNSGERQLIGAALHVANSGNGPLHYIACSTQPWLSFDCVTETSYDPNSVVWQTPEVETGYNPNDERVTCRGWAPCNPPPTETCHCPGNETCYNPGNETCYCPGNETHYCPGNETCYCPPETNYNPPPETCYQTRYVLPPQKEHVIRVRCNPAGLPDGDYQAPLPVMACDRDGGLQTETAYYNLHVRTLPEGFFTSTTQINLSYPQDAGEQTFEFEVQHRPDPAAGAENMYIISYVAGTATSYEATPTVGDKTITVRLIVIPTQLEEGKTYTGQVVLSGNMIGQLLIPVTLTITEAVHKPDFVITSAHQSVKLIDRNWATVQWAVSVRNDDRFYMGDPVQIGLYRETPNGLELLMEQSGYWFPPGQAQGFVFTSTVPNPTSMTLRAVVNLSHAVHENNYDNNISEAMQVNSDWPIAPDEIIDNSDPKVNISGEWTLTSDSLNLYGPDCLVDAIPDDGQNVLTIYPKVPRAGNYWVEAAWPSGPERSLQIGISNQLPFGTNFVTTLNQTVLGEVIPGAGEWHPVGNMFMVPDQDQFIFSNWPGAPGAITFDALSFWFLGPDDPYESNNTRETAFDMTAWPYGDIFSTLGMAMQGDTDWYRLDSANRGGQLSLEAFNRYDMGVALFNETGQRIASNSPGGYILDESSNTWHDVGAAMNTQTNCRAVAVGNTVYLVGENYCTYMQRIDLGSSSTAQPEWQLSQTNNNFAGVPGNETFLASVGQQLVMIHPDTRAAQRWDTPNTMLSSMTAWPGNGDSVRGLNSNAVVDGNCYLIGGVKSDGQRIDEIHSYNVTSDTWTLNVASYPIAASGISTVADQGKIYCLGGQTADGVVANDCYLYDPSTGSLTPLAPMPTARCKASSFVRDGKIWVCGGQDGYGQPINNIECYDPALGMWQPGPALPDNLVGGIVAAALADGRVVLFDQPFVGDYAGHTMPSNDAIYYLRFTGMNDGRAYSFRWM
jgi:hypothetical protein